MVVGGNVFLFAWRKNCGDRIDDPDHLDKRVYVIKYDLNLDHTLYTCGTGYTYDGGYSISTINDISDSVGSMGLVTTLPSTTLLVEVDENEQILNYEFGHLTDTT